VLVVDDHQETREVYAWCLRAAGWHVQEATNGEEAVTLAPLFDLDVILMDLCMPSLDGVEATRRLKMDPRTKHVPIIACTSVGSRRIEQSARDAGCVRVVCKPCSPDELRELLEGLVAGEGQGIATNHPG
jgi:two-component system chemotaxis response regulator CheY